MKVKLSFVGVLALVVIAVAGCGQPTKADIDEYFNSFDAANNILIGSINNFADTFNDTGTMQVEEQQQYLGDIHVSLDSLKKVHCPNVTALRTWNNSIIGYYEDYANNAQKQIQEEQVNDIQGSLDATDGLWSDNQHIESLIKNEPSLKDKYG